ncbi:MAG: putative sugar O-methyltransferase [Candidatus Omnitrophota bacterium]|nr:putative sugar O-methyltransferase [Candidatus Omnitrophota bacterium]MDZ4243110.1 putative sugar O-methyltransferase [Candidatus Omnitrophota bacterium]
MSGAEILDQLYERYYREDYGREDVSPHWKQLQGRFRVRRNDDGRLELHGEGFGDLEKVSFSSRLLSGITAFSYLIHLSLRLEIFLLLPRALVVLKAMGLSFTYDGFRQICSLALIKTRMSPASSFTVMVIGDGYGFLSCLIKSVWPDSRIVLVDLGKTLLFQAHFCGKAHPGEARRLVQPGTDARSLPARGFIYCPAEHLACLEGLRLDGAINTASMQEMTSSAIAGYFQFLRRNLVENGWFYCCNREEKEFPGGEIVRFAEYPWDSGDRHLVDEEAPWYKYFFSLHKTRRGLRLAGVRVPFINAFDGPVRHRLSVLKKFSS